MIPGFGQALADKYAILGEHANAAMTGANAAMIGARGQANLANANAGEVAANAASQRAQQAAQTGEVKARTSTIDPLAQSTIGLQGHQGGYYDSVGSASLMHGQAALQDSSSLTDLRNAQIPEIGAETRGIDNSLQPFHAGSADVLRPLSDAELHMIHAHLCAGTGMVHAMGGMSQVPGQATPAAQVGTQASDKVPAMLAPDEAVLNKHGADIIGRDKIAAANAIGNHMAQQERQNAPTAQNAPQGRPPAGKPAPGKGMIQPKGKAAPGGPTRHFAEGSPNVGGLPNRGYFSEGTLAGPNYADWREASAGSRSAGVAEAKVLLDRGYAAKPQNFASGTHQVAHGKSAKTPTKIDPAAAMALLQMAKGGGGMPAPQPGGMPAPQGNPMPMQPSL